MTNDLYVPLNETQLHLCVHITAQYYCEYSHLLRARYVHICTFAVYYQVDLMIKP